MDEDTVGTYRRGSHRGFSAGTLARIGRRFSEDMPPGCERFCVIYR